ncbi:MAG: hypothetical protein ABW042_08320 [Phenylobacterium sp.]
MTAAVADEKRIDIGRVLSETIGVLRRNLGSFTLIGAVAALPALPVFGVLARNAATVADPGESALAGLTIMGLYLEPLPVLVAGALAWFALSAAAYGALNYGTLRDLDGRPTRLPELLMAGVRTFVPMALITTLTTLGMLLGLMLLLVPGVILMLMWYVALPANISERLGILASLARSAELTRNNRLMILVLFIIIVAVSWVVARLAEALATSIAAGQAAALTQVIAAALTTPFSTVIGAVLFVELRRIKEGGGPGGLAAYFD